MKIQIYKIESIKPNSPEQYEEFCDIVNTPTLKYGSIEVVTDKIGFLTLGELRKRGLIAAKYYNMKTGIYMEGVMIIQGFENESKAFAFIPSLYNR